MEWYTAATHFTNALASAEPTPGGGAAAAHTGTMGCALLMMAIGTTLKRKQIDAGAQARLNQSIKRLGSLKVELTNYVQQDAHAYTAYLTARRMPKENPQRPEVLQQALVGAARVPADTAATALRVLKEADIIKPDIAPVILSDLTCAQVLLKACIRCAVENIRANRAYITNPDVAAELDKQITTFLKAC